MSKLIDSGWLKHAVTNLNNKTAAGMKRVKEMAKEMAFKMRTPQLIPLRTWQIAKMGPSLRGSDLDAAHSFFQEMVANPEDNVPRMVFADWLDERDDPRGTAMRGLMPLSAEMNPLAFDGPRVTQHKLVVDGNGRPDEVLMPLWGDGSKGLYAAEMRWSTPDEREALYWAAEEANLKILRPTVTTWQHPQHQVQFDLLAGYSDTASRKMYGFPAGKVACKTECRFTLSFKMRLFVSEERARHALPIGEREFDPPGRRFQPYAHLVMEADGEFFCHGTLRDPTTALILSLSRLMPEHAEYIERL